MPIAICNRVSGPPGRVTVQGRDRPPAAGSRPRPHQATSAMMIAKAIARLSHGGSWSMLAAASG